MMVQQHTSHHPPSGQGQATQPVLGAEGFVTEVVELPELEGKVSFTGAAWAKCAMATVGGIYRYVDICTGCCSSFISLVSLLFTLTRPEVVR